MPDQLKHTYESKDIADQEIGDFLGKLLREIEQSIPTELQESFGNMKSELDALKIDVGGSLDRQAQLLTGYLSVLENKLEEVSGSLDKQNAEQLKDISTLKELQGKVKKANERYTAYVMQEEASVKRVAFSTHAKSRLSTIYRSLSMSTGSSVKKYLASGLARLMKKADISFDRVGG